MKKRVLLLLLTVVLAFSQNAAAFAGMLYSSGEPTENGALVMDRLQLTMKSSRAITLRAEMHPYDYSRRHITWSSSDENVVTVEKVSDPTLPFPWGTAKLHAVNPGTSTITATGVETHWTTTCQVTVTEENTTWHKSSEDIKDLSVSELAAMEVYDGRDLGYMTDVNLQVGGICTVEGHITAMETSLVKQGILSKKEADIHERNLVYHYYNHGGDDPLGNTIGDETVNLNWQNEALRSFPLSAFMTQWNGPIHDDKKYGQELDDGYAGCIARPEDILHVSGNTDQLKRLIAEYGAIVIGYQSSPEGTLYHKYNTHGLGWHCSAIVGWDDTVEKENFTVQGQSMSKAMNDGAWIVKNSWGTDKHGDGHGYFYLSYEATIERPIVYKMMPKDAYQYNYFYDGKVENKEYIPIVRLEDGQAAAVSFKAQKGGTETGKEEYLEAVNVGISGNGLVEVEVYTDVDEASLLCDQPDPLNGSKAAATGKRELTFGGFYTIRLDQPVKLEPGKYFTIVVRMPGGGAIYSAEETSKNDLTFKKEADGRWNNTSRNTLRIKGFTNLRTDEELEQDYRIEPESVALDRKELTMTEGSTDALTASVTPADALDQTLSWESSDHDVVTVDCSGRLTAVAPGTAKVTVTTVNGKTAVCNVTVKEKEIQAELVTLDQTELTLTEGDTASLSATVLPEAATNKTVTWESSDDTIVSVDGNGKLTAKAPGEAEITVTTTNGKNAKCKVTVKARVIPVESVTLDKEELTLTEGDTASLSATVQPANATDKTVTWESSDDTIVSVDGNGKLTAKAPGEAEITVTATNGKNAKCKVKVKARVIPVESVTLDQEELTLTEGDTAELTATVLPANATDKTVTWKSSDDTIVSVNGNGKLTAKAPGEAEITVTTIDGEKTAVCKVMVEARVIPVESVTLDQTELTLTEGDTADLTATVRPANATDKTVTWKSSDDTIVSVDGNGKLTAKAPGEAEITVTATNGKNAKCKVKVNARVIPVESVTLDQTELTLTEGDTAGFSATVLPANATDKAVTWKSSDDTIVSIDENGNLMAKAPGEAEITVTTKDGGKTDACRVTVKARVIPVENVTLDQTELTLTEGDTVDITATVQPANATDKAVTWESSDDTIVSVDGNGKLTAKAPGEAEITVTTIDGEKTAVCKVTVEAASKPTPDPDTGSGKVEVEAAPQPGAPTVSIPADVHSAIENAVLTPEDKEAVEKGAKIKIELTVADVGNTVTAAEKKAVSNCISKDGRSFVVGQYLDISLLKIIEGAAQVSITNTGSAEITIVVTVPESLRVAGRTFAIVRLHDGAADILEDGDKDPNTITFKTNKFSSYTIVYEDQMGAEDTPKPEDTVKPVDTSKPADTSAPSTHKPDSPATGDKTSVFMLLLLMLGSFSIMLAVSVKFSRKQ